MISNRINLAYPIGPISSVPVLLPPENERDVPPAGVDVAIWNLSRVTGLTVEQALQLHQSDIEALAVAFEAAVKTWNTGQLALRAGVGTPR